MWIYTPETGRAVRAGRRAWGVVDFFSPGTRRRARHACCTPGAPGPHVMEGRQLRAAPCRVGLPDAPSRDAARSGFGPPRIPISLSTWHCPSRDDGTEAPQVYLTRANPPIYH